MLHCTRHETGLIKEGKSVGIVRRYDHKSGCPHAPGSIIFFANNELDDSGRQIPFASATVITVRRGTVSEFSKDPMIAEMDGFKSLASWISHLRVLYKGIGASDTVYHIKFRMDDMDKEAGTRG